MRSATIVSALLMVSLLPLLSVAEPFELEPVASIPAWLAPGGSYEYAYNIRILEDGVYAVLALTYVGEMNKDMLLDLEYLTAGTVKALRGRVDVPPDAKPGPVFVIFYVFYETEKEYAIKDDERTFLQSAVPAAWSYIPEPQAERALAECKTELDELNLRYLQTDKALAECREQLGQRQNLYLALAAAALIVGLAIGYVIKT